MERFILPGGGNRRVTATAVSRAAGAQTAILKVVNGKCLFLCTLPSGPRPDHSYIGAARRPDDPRRFALSFYSNVIAPEDPAIDQWNHPDIYVADVRFGPVDTAQ